MQATDPEEHDEIQKLITKASKIPLDASDNSDDTVFVVGNTGSGKSTLIAYALGYNLIANEGSADDLVLSVAADNDAKVPIISHAAQSQTQLPEKYVDSYNKIAYWDCPGEKDTNGAAQDIIHAMLMKRLSMLYKNKKIKIMLVVSDRDIFDRGGDFRRLVDYVGSWFTDEKEILGGLYMIVTKTKANRKADSVRKRIQDILDSSSDLSMLQTAVMNSLIHENSSVTVFPAPIEDGYINKEKHTEIVHKIKELSGCYPSNTKLSLTAGSKTFLSQKADTIKRNIAYNLSQISKIVQKECRRGAKDLTEYSAVQKMIKTIQDLFLALSNKTSFQDLLRTLSLDPLLLVGEVQALIPHLENSINSLESIQEIYPTLTPEPPCWKTPFIEASKLMNSLTEFKQQFDVHTFTLRIEGAIISLGYILQEISRQQKTLISVEVFCTNTIFMDDDIDLPGVNLTVIAPIWRITRPVTVNLSGRPGNPVYDQEGTNGKVGQVGGNGGNFIGRAYEASGLDNLIINVSGGNGGDGAPGVDGEDGKNGQDGSREDVENRDDKVLNRRYKAGFKEGKVQYMFEALFTFNDRIIYEYESQGTRGEDGKAGGLGGCGGRGGHFGRVDIAIQKQPQPNIANRYRVVASAGAHGEPGRQGKAGKGGEGGNTYYGSYQEAMMFAGMRGKGEEYIPEKVKQDSEQSEQIAAIQNEPEEDRSLELLIPNASAKKQEDQEAQEEEKVNQSTDKKNIGNAGIITGSVTGAAGATAAGYIARENTKEIIKQVATEVSKNVATNAARTAGQEMTKGAVRQAGKEIATKVAEQVGQEALKTVGKDTVQGIVQGAVVQNAASVGVSSAGRIAASAGARTANVTSIGGSLLSVGSMLKGIGLSLAAQGVVSAIHSKVAEGWLDEIKTRKEEDGKDGEMTTEKNRNGIVFPEGNRNLRADDVCMEFREHFERSDEFRSGIFDVFV